MPLTRDRRLSDGSSSNWHMSTSSLVLAYMQSLPKKLSFKEELMSYQFWKALRIELLVSFLFFLFGCGSLFNTGHMIDNVSHPVVLANLTDASELKWALTFGLTIATLVQCVGHVSGCHLTVAITLGLFVSGRVSSVRVGGYLVAHILGSCLAAILQFTLFGFVQPIQPSTHIMANQTTAAGQVFAFEFLFTFLVVLTYLANCDERRRDLGFKSLSIGMAATVGHLFAFPNTGASLSPARALAASLLTDTWCLHWVYWVSPLVAGLFAGISYEYIGSIKPVSTISSVAGDDSSELKHRFTDKPRSCNSSIGVQGSMSPTLQSVITSPSSNIAISTIYQPAPSHSQQTLHLPTQLLSSSTPMTEGVRITAETEFNSSPLIDGNGIANNRTMGNGAEPSLPQQRPEPEGSSRQAISNHF